MYYEDYQRACSKLCEALREYSRFRDLIRIEFIPMSEDNSEPKYAICHFENTRATVNIMCNNVWGMICAIIIYLNDIAEHRQDWDE